jgi:hypothetical protein
MQLSVIDFDPMNPFELSQCVFWRRGSDVNAD